MQGGLSEGGTFLLHMEGITIPITFRDVKQTLGLPVVVPVRPLWSIFFYKLHQTASFFECLGLCQVDDSCRWEWFPPRQW